MGLFSSKSTSSTSSSNTNIDQKLQLADNAIGATASGGGTVNISTFDGGAVDSSFKFANAVSDNNALLTDGALTFAGARSDSAFRLVNSTVDSAMKGIEQSARQAAESNARISDGAFRLANAATDSALRFGDSAVSQSFDFAAMLTKGTVNELAASGTRSNALAVSAMGAVEKAYGGANDKLADAYANSKAGEQKMLAFGVVALIALAVIKMVSK